MQKYSYDHGTSFCSDGAQKFFQSLRENQKFYEEPKLITYKGAFTLAEFNLMEKLQERE